MKYRIITMINEKKLVTKLFETIDDDIAFGILDNEADIYRQMERDGKIFSYVCTLYRKVPRNWIPLHHSQSDMLHMAIAEAMNEGFEIRDDDSEMWR